MQWDLGSDCGFNLVRVCHWLGGVGWVLLGSWAHLSGSAQSCTAPPPPHPTKRPRSDLEEWASVLQIWQMRSLVHHNHFLFSICVQKLQHLFWERLPFLFWTGPRVSRRYSGRYEKLSRRDDWANTRISTSWVLTHRDLKHSRCSVFHRLLNLDKR